MFMKIVGILEIVWLIGHICWSIYCLKYKYTEHKNKIKYCIVIIQLFVPLFIEQKIELNSYQVLTTQTGKHFK